MNKKFAPALAIALCALFTQRTAHAQEAAGQRSAQCQQAQQHQSPAIAADDLGSLTMRHAIALALQNSRDLTLARMQYRAAANAASLDKAAFMPNLSTGSGAAYTYGFPS